RQSWAPVSWRPLGTALRGGVLARTAGDYTGRERGAQARGPAAAIPFDRRSRLSCNRHLAESDRAVFSRHVEPRRGTRDGMEDPMEARVHLAAAVVLGSIPLLGCGRALAPAAPVASIDRTRSLGAEPGTRRPPPPDSVTGANQPPVVTILSPHPNPLLPPIVTPSLT